MVDFLQVGAVIRYWKGSAYKVRKGSAYKVQWCFFYRKFRKMTAIRYSGIFFTENFRQLLPLRYSGKFFVHFLLWIFSLLERNIRFFSLYMWNFSGFNLIYLTVTLSQRPNRHNWPLITLYRAETSHTCSASSETLKFYRQLQSDLYFRF